MPLWTLILAAYLVGSIPTAWLLVRARTGQDLRRIGSGNVGATNAGRVLGRSGAVLVYALDLLKGLLPVLVARVALGDPGVTSAVPLPAPLVVGLAAILGHLFPVWLLFRGGKGVATSSGVLLGTVPLTFLLAVVVFAVTVRLTRMISAGSVLSALSLPVAYALLTPDATEAGPRLATLLALAGLGLAVAWMHRTNIHRILGGDEPRIGVPRS